MSLRRVRTLRLAAAGEDLARRGAILVEDALRTASLPAVDGGRLLLVRTLPLGRVRATPPRAGLRWQSRKRSSRSTRRRCTPCTRRPPANPLSISVTRARPSRPWPCASPAAKIPAPGSGRWQCRPGSRAWDVMRRCAACWALRPSRRTAWPGRWRSWTSFREQDALDALLAGLRAAGWSGPAARLGVAEAGTGGAVANTTPAPPAAWREVRGPLGVSLDPKRRPLDVAGRSGARRRPAGAAARRWAG